MVKAKAPKAPKTTKEAIDMTNVMLLPKEHAERILDMLIDYRYVIEATQYNQNKIKDILKEFLKWPDEKLPPNVDRATIEADLKNQEDQDKLIDTVLERRETLLKAFREFLHIQEQDNVIEGELIPADWGLSDEDVQSIHEVSEDNQDVLQEQTDPGNLPTDSEFEWPKSTTSTTTPSKSTTEPTTESD